jgi:hypothetical protein
MGKMQFSGSSEFSKPGPQRIHEQLNKQSYAIASHWRFPGGACTERSVGVVISTEPLFYKDVRAPSGLKEDCFTQHKPQRSQ